jgi:hypothetical protein
MRHPIQQRTLEQHFPELIFDFPRLHLLPETLPVAKHAGLCQ